MELYIFMWVAIVSSCLAFVGLILFTLFPAWKRAKIAEALVVLARCCKKLDQNALINGRIQQGQYLHDNFYKLIYSILLYKINLKTSLLVKKIDDHDLECAKIFRREIDSLDKETRDTVNQAMVNILIILFLRSPVVSTMLFISVLNSKTNQINKPHGLFKKLIAASAEVLTVKADQNDYDVVPCRI